MDEDKEYLTKEKHNELTRELALLKTVRRKEVAEQLEYAKSLGDLSENAEYQEARNTQGQVEDRISHLEAILKNAEIVAPRHSSVAGVGSTVTVRRVKNGVEKTYEIVGSEEADTDAGKISDQSPLGAVLIGKEKGDRVLCCAPAGDVEYEVVGVQ